MYNLNHLLTAIPQGSVIVMDNASFHKNPAIRAAIELAGHERLYLPPHSPDLNPIEKSWAALKRHLTLLDALSHAFYNLFSCFDSHRS